MERHHLLPQTGAVDALGEWLRNNARERFNDEQKILFEDNEINNMARQSSGSGAEIISLNETLKEVTDAVKNGREEPLTIVIYPTSGTKVLDKQRQELDTQVKMGYRTEKREIFGIPCEDTKQMVYFDEIGREVADRNRPLSAREKHEYLGMFKDSDTSTGEDLRASRLAI